LIEILEEPELHSEAIPVEFFYLWRTKLEMFNLFKIIRLYLKDGQLDPTLIFLLCEKRKLDVETALLDLPLILSGYNSVIYPPQDKDNGRPESNHVYD
jgi:hypothetical protein